MFLLWALVIGVVIGFLRHGTLGNLSRLRFKWVWLLLPALVIQVLIFPIGTGAPIVRTGTQVLHLLSYAFLIAFIAVNYRLVGLSIMGIGLGLNTVVIAANRGYMPASIAALRHAGMAKTVAALEQTMHHGNTVIMSAATQLNFLGDRFSVPAAVPFATAFSIGDILLAIGVIAFLAIEMPRKSQ